MILFKQLYLQISKLPTRFIVMNAQDKQNNLELRRLQLTKNKNKASEFNFFPVRPFTTWSINLYYQSNFMVIFLKSNIFSFFLSLNLILTFGTTCWVFTAVEQIQDFCIFQIASMLPDSKSHQTKNTRSDRLLQF